MNVSKERITRRTLGGPIAKKNWSQFDSIKDEEIAEAVKNDPDAAHLIDESWLEGAQVILGDSKVPVTIRLDRDVVNFFKSAGSGYQTRINAVLRSFMEHQQHSR